VNQIRRPLFPLALLVLLGGLIALLIGCKQGEGERCQVTADCRDGLQCNQGTVPPTCQANPGGDLDATLPIDAPDAAIDAAIDAPPDV
jgi:hypothetical protein